MTSEEKELGGGSNKGEVFCKEEEVRQLFKGQEKSHDDDDNDKVSARPRASPLAALESDEGSNDKVIELWKQGRAGQDQAPPAMINATPACGPSPENDDITMGSAANNSAREHHRPRPLQIRGRSNYSRL